MYTTKAQICIRRDTAANFTNASPAVVLALGEIAYETDTRNLKVGDGATAWTSLPYINPYRAGTAAAPTSNTVMGSGAGDAQDATAFNNTLIGQNAGTAITSGNRIVAIGTEAGAAISTGNQGTFIGNEAGRFFTGSQNVAVGNEALVGVSGSSTGTANVAIGQGAAKSMTSGSNVVAVGTAAALLNTASDTVAIGSGALDANTTGTSNTAVGRNALGATTTGGNSTAVGHGALASQTTGSINDAFGVSALAALTGGAENVAIGRLSATALNGDGNVALGTNAIASPSSASRNCVIGRNAGRYVGGTATPLTTTNNSIFIGEDCQPSGDSQTNQIVIGQAGRGNGSNTTTIGNSSTTNTWLSGLLVPGNTSGFGSSGFHIRGTGSDNGLMRGGYVSVDATIFAVRNNAASEEWLRAQSQNVTIGLGNLVIGTSGKGIDFSATANSSGTMTSELLNDYEEGTWTPVYEPSTGAFGTVTQDLINAFYTKVGRLVTASATYRIDSFAVGTGGGILRIAGLPFAANGSGATQLTSGIVSQSINWAANRSPFAVQTATGQTYLNVLYRAASDGAPSFVDAADLTNQANGNQITFTISYIV